MERLEALKQELHDTTEGEVRLDAINRNVYSVDASIYEVPPVAVVIPKSLQDLVQTVYIARRHGLSVTPRGAGTGITGGCLGEGIIVDTSKYMNKILEINYEKEYVICEPGLIQDTLNEALSPAGFRLGPDTSTGNRATIGGMVANNAAGARSLFYGKMSDHILGAEIILSSGKTLYLEEKTDNELQKILSENTYESEIYKKIIQIKHEYKNEIEKNFPAIPRRVSGYNLDELIKPGNINLSKLIAGSEGTLGIISKLKIKISKKPAKTGFCILFFHDLIEGLQYISKILTYTPLSAEMIDRNILEAGKKSPSFKGKSDLFPGDPDAIFVVEFQSTNEEELKETLLRFASDMKKEAIGYEQKIILDIDEINRIWEIRKAGLGLLLSKRTYSRAIAFIEDLSLPPSVLFQFMKKFRLLLQKYKKQAGIYGHIGSGCMHIRPYIDLRNAEEIEIMKKIMWKVTDLLIEHGGTLSGEHGDGFIRTWLNEKLFGKKNIRSFFRS